jgi:hypothetical protein
MRNPMPGRKANTVARTSRSGYWLPAMIIDMHTRAGRPDRSGPVDRAALAALGPGGVAAAAASAIAALPMIQLNPTTKRLDAVRDREPEACDFLAGGLDPGGLVNVAHCREAAVAGAIGAWIAVRWQERLHGMIRHLFRLIDAAGVDHAGIGSDLPAGASKTRWLTSRGMPRSPWRCAVTA